MVSPSKQFSASGDFAARKHLAMSGGRHFWLSQEVNATVK